MIETTTQLRSLNFIAVSRHFHFIYGLDFQCRRDALQIGLQSPTAGRSLLTAWNRTYRLQIPAAVVGTGTDEIKLGVPLSLLSSGRAIRCPGQPAAAADRRAVECNDIPGHRPHGGPPSTSCCGA